MSYKRFGISKELLVDIGVYFVAYIEKYTECNLLQNFNEMNNEQTNYVKFHIIQQVLRLRILIRAHIILNHFEALCMFLMYYNKY